MAIGRPLAALAAVAAMVGVGCGGGGGSGDPAQGGSSGGAQSGGAGGSPGAGQGGAANGAGGGSGKGGASLRPADPAATRVIRHWSDALRRGDVKRATDDFAIPSLVENNSPPMRLRARADVRAFNESLPCGASLERTYRMGRYTAAVFRLTDRPGGDCGTGIGGQAATAFVIRRGRIVEWRRLPDPVGPTDVPGAVVPVRPPTVTGPEA
jgi:limonene-1,2-epoxide hydrolase